MRFLKVFISNFVRFLFFCRMSSSSDDFLSVFKVDLDVPMGGPEAHIAEPIPGDVEVAVIPAEVAVIPAGAVLPAGDGVIVIDDDDEVEELMGDEAVTSTLPPQAPLDVSEEAGEVNLGGLIIVDPEEI